ncbi:MAG: hypothetical protein WBW55_02175 [Desulfobaccales bacterium]
MENNRVPTTEEAAAFLKLTPFTVPDYARRKILGRDEFTRESSFNHPGNEQDWQGPPAA